MQTLGWFYTISSTPKNSKLNIKDICLPGTRKDTIDTVLGWATGAASTSILANREGTDIQYSTESRVLWICGLSGSGKSTIARSVASQLEKIGRLGSFYAFNRAHSELNPSTMFTTIARDLADCDDTREKRLVESIKDSTARRLSPNVSDQFSEFIVAPASELGVIGDTIVIIDAFDESSDVAGRAELLHILTSRASEIPLGLKFVVTSRFEPDVQQNVGTSQHSKGVDLFLLDNVTDDSTSHDINMFVQYKLANDDQLRHQKTDLDRLAKMSEQSFQWASTACRYILAIDDGKGASRIKRLSHVIESTAGGLDELYKLILDHNFGAADHNTSSQLQSMLGLIVCAAEPLTLRLMVVLSFTNDAPPKAELSSFHQMATLLASLLTGVHNLDTPVKPIHTSFADFLRDPERSAKYSIDQHHITLRCLEIMVCGGLKFNICEFPSSFMRNDDVGKLREIICDKISMALSYACRYWPRHVAELDQDESGEVNALLLTLLRDHFLSWLEVMSLLKCNPHTAITNSYSRVSLTVKI